MNEKPAAATDRNSTDTAAEIGRYISLQHIATLSLYLAIIANEEAAAKKTAPGPSGPVPRP